MVMTPTDRAIVFAGSSSANRVANVPIVTSITIQTADRAVFIRSYVSKLRLYVQGVEFGGFPRRPSKRPARAAKLGDERG